MKEIIFSKITFKQFLWFLASPFVWLLNNKESDSIMKWSGKAEASFKDFFSILMINISVNDQKVFVKKNAGILTPYDVPEINTWIDAWEGNVSEIKNISLESDVYLMDPYWEEEDSDDVFMPRFIFINLKNDRKILAAVFYDRKLAKKIASEIERKLFNNSIEWYEVDCLLLKEISATKNTEGIKPFNKKIAFWKSKLHLIYIYSLVYVILFLALISYLLY